VQKRECITIQELYDEVHAERSFAPRIVGTHAGAWRRVPADFRSMSVGDVRAIHVENVLAGISAFSVRQTRSWSSSTCCRSRGTPGGNRGEDGL
jgi:hypothetical protein